MAASKESVGLRVQEDEINFILDSSDQELDQCPQKLDSDNGKSSSLRADEGILSTTTVAASQRLSLIDKSQHIDSTSTAFDEEDGSMHEEATVDEMKIQTMYKMVEDVNVVVGGQTVSKKVLYLTNKQAYMFDESAVERCIQALDIRDSKFVIQLLPSLGVASQMLSAHPEIVGTAFTEYCGSSYLDSNLSSTDARTVEEQLNLFMRSCILPLAKETRAVIFVAGANDCSLCAALANVALTEQERLGKDCPFTVVATASEYEVHYRAVDYKNAHTVAAQVAKGCRAWRKRLPAASKAWASLIGTGLQQCDLTHCASRYIIFEGLDDTPGHKLTENTGPRGSLESLFLSCLTKRLPSVAIQSFSVDLGIAHLNTLVARGIPVLFLDPFERAITIKRPLGAEGPRTALAREAEAFPCISRARAAKITAQESSGETNLEGGKELLSIAWEMMERKWKRQIANHVVDVLDSGTLALLHSALRLGGDAQYSASGPVPLHMRIRELQTIEKYNKDSNRVVVHPDLVAEAVSIFQTKDLASQQLARLARVEWWLQNHDAKVNELNEEALEYRAKLVIVCEQILKNNNSLSHTALDYTVWLAAFNLLSSPNTFSGSLYDIDELKRILGSVAKIDRLPSSNSLEALRTIQDAWDHVEVYHQDADWYKTAAKSAYKLMLIIGILMTILSVLDLTHNLGISCRIPILVLSVLETTIAAYVSFMNPALRWQQLRMAALTIESNIWLFRTRAGVYRTSSGNFDFDRRAEKLLARTVHHIKSVVLEGADVKQTSFYGKFKPSSLHGQRAASTSESGLAAANSESPLQGQKNGARKPQVNSGQIVPLETAVEIEDNVPLDEVVSAIWGRTDNVVEAEDSHYEPLQPDAYIRYRVQRALTFYKQRIPRYSLARHIGQLVLVVGSCTSGIVAFFDVPVWAAVISAVSFSISHYLEFAGTNTKLSRYSATVHAFRDVVSCWQELPKIDRSVVANIDQLVTSCEDILLRDQQAWRSTSQVQRMLSKHSRQMVGQDEHSTKTE